MIEKSLIDAALKAVFAAGKEILDVYSRPVEVSYKEDRSPLTEADRRAHLKIVEILEHACPDIPLLSEEGVHLSFDERSLWNRYWLIDPLDGTKEFIKRNGEFTVNIALIEKREEAFVPVIGLVYVPVSDLLYLGVSGRGAFRLEDAGESGITDAARIEERAKRLTADGVVSSGIRAVVSRSHGSPETEALLERLKERYGRVERISSGSSIKLCLVADGSADIYPRFAPTMEWDTAAGDAVCRAAGCMVTEADGKTPLQYNKEDLHNPWFMVFHKQLKDNF